jgi:tetratricopeptide (TPR) repeat protein
MDDGERGPEGGQAKPAESGRDPAGGHEEPQGEGPPAGDRSEAYDLYQRGHAFLRGDHPGQAALLLERARRLAPGKNSVREALGRAYFHLGRYEHAAGEFAAVLECVPTNDYARYALGRCYLKLGRLAEARAQLRLAVAMSPENRWYRLALERCLARERGGGADDGRAARPES